MATQGLRHSPQAQPTLPSLQRSSQPPLQLLSRAAPAPCARTRAAPRRRCGCPHPCRGPSPAPAGSPAAAAPGGPPAAAPAGWRGGRGAGRGVGFNTCSGQGRAASASMEFSPLLARTQDKARPSDPLLHPHPTLPCSIPTPAPRRTCPRIASGADLTCCRRQLRRSCTRAWLAGWRCR